MMTETGPGLSSNPDAGLPCPECRTRIQFPLQALLLNPTIRCPSCGLELTLDFERSEGALAALRQFASEIDSIRRDQAAGPQDPDD